MSDTTKRVDLEFNYRGDALANVKALRAETEALERARRGYNAAMGPQMPGAGAGDRAGAAQSPYPIPGAAGGRPVIPPTSGPVVQPSPAARPPNAVPGSGNAGGGMPGGLPGGAAAGVAVALVALKTAEEALRKFAAVANIANNSTTSMAQKFEQFAQQVPLVGGLITAGFNAYKAALNIPEQLRAGNFAHAVGMTEGAAQAQAQVQRDQLAQQASGYRTQADALAKLPAYNVGNTARTSLMEQVQYGERQQLLPHQQAINLARAKAEAAQTDLANTQRLTADSRGKVSDFEKAMKQHKDLLQRRLMNTDEMAGVDLARGPMGKGGARAVAERALPYAADIGPDIGKLKAVGKKAWNDPRSLTMNDVLTVGEQSAKALPGVGPVIGGQIQAAKGIEAETGAFSKLQESIEGQVKAVNRVSGAIQDQQRLTAERQRLEKLTTDEFERQKQVINANAEAKREEVALGKEELAILRQREQVAQSNAQRLGMMSRLQRKRDTDALEQLQRIGIQNAPEFLKQRAAQIAPRTVQNLAEQAGEKSPEFERLKRLAGGEYRDRLVDVRHQVDEKQKQVGKQEQINLAEPAAKIADTFERAAGQLAQLIDVKIQAAVNRIVLDQRFKAANGG